MKKLLLTLFLIINCSLMAFSLPGFTPYLPDQSGEYVYYRDFSFERESYIGLLCYDETNYQIKYYAPKDDVQFLPEKTVALLFSVNPEAAFFDMTGERIITTILPDSDDLDILNYLHDILYDFSSRRIKIDEVNTRDVQKSSDYEQFGGKVTMYYDCTIPLFNLKKIEGADGKILLECATTGTLRSSADNSFDEFKGMKSKSFELPKKKFSSKAKAKKFKTNDNQTVTLDSDWSQAMENCWTLGNDAIITISTIPQISADENFDKLYILRQLMESSTLSYSDYSNIEILEDAKENRIKITSKNYQQESGNYITNIKILTKTNEDYKYFSLAAFEPNYTNKRNYFDKIIKSYK